MCPKQYNCLPCGAGLSSTSQGFNRPVGHSIASLLYTISSVDAGGSESVLSETVDNSLRVITKHEYIDTDGDGLLDAIEEAIVCLDKYDADTDDDGILDGDEDEDHDGVFGLDDYETHPCFADTDKDGIQDGTELGITDPVTDPDGSGPLLGTDTDVFIADADPSTTTDPLDDDSDNDGKLDGEEDENHNGRVVSMRVRSIQILVHGCRLSRCCF